MAKLQSSSDSEYLNCFADFEQVTNLVIILLALKQSKNLVVILLLIAGHSCVLDILLNPSYLCPYFWGANFKMHFLRKNFKRRYNFFQLSLISDILFVKAKKITQTFFQIFNAIFTLLIYFTCTRFFSIPNKIAKCNRAVIALYSNTFLLTKIVSHTLLKRNPQTLLKISSTNTTQKLSTGVTQN